MDRSRGWVIALGALVLALAGCNGGGSSSGSGHVRLVNLTRSHASLDMLSSSTKVVGAVTTSTASGYVDVSAGSASLQVNAAGSATALTTLGPTIGDDQSYAFVVYESGTTLKTTWIGENDTTPTSGSAQLRFVDLAGDAGAIDIYVTAPDVALTSSVSPNLSLAASASVQSSALTSLTPGTYRVRVTAAGNAADVRLDMPSLTLANQQVANVLLLPAAGGGLVDGAALIEKGALTVAATPQARVRLVSGVAGGTIGAASAAGVVEPGAASPTIGSYVTLPSGASTWTISANGVAVATPTLTLAAGADYALLVSGSAQAPAVALLVDDNRAPATSTNSSMRLVNGMAGSAGLSLTVDFALVAINVLPGSASAYKAVAGNTGMRLQVDSPASVTPVSLHTGLNVTGGGVYTVFVLGDSAAPVTVLRRDR